METVPLSLYFDLNNKQEKLEEVKSSDIRSGVFEYLPYILISSSSSWQVPAHWQSDKVTILAVGGGGAGGDYSQLNIRASNAPNAGGDTDVIINSVPKIKAQGGKQGYSKHSKQIDPGPLPLGASHGGTGSIPIDTNVNMPDDIKNEKYLLMSKGSLGKTGNTFSDNNYHSVGGAGAAGLLPFADPKPNRWIIPIAGKGNSETPSVDSKHSGSGGSGFGSGGGASSPQYSSSDAGKNYNLYRGPSGGGRGKVKHITFPYQPNDVIECVIGKGGNKKSNSDALKPGKGSDGVVMLLFPNAINWFPVMLPNPNIDDFYLHQPENIVSSTMEAGNVKFRKVSNLMQFFVSCFWSFSQQEFDIFSYWFYKILKDGTRSFLLPVNLPNGIKYHFARFSNPFSAKLYSHDLWKIKASICIFATPSVISSLYLKTNYNNRKTFVPYPFNLQKK